MDAIDTAGAPPCRSPPPRYSSQDNGAPAMWCPCPDTIGEPHSRGAQVDGEVGSAVNARLLVSSASATSSSASTISSPAYPG